MASFEASYKSLLQGVSQQVARERLPGQVSAQENMLSDIVTNVRRRPGAEFKFALQSIGATANNIGAWFTDIAGERVHVILECTSGTIRVLDEDLSVDATLGPYSYLQASHIGHIRTTTVGNEFFILNKEKVPTKTTGGADTSVNGFFYVRTAAFSKTYSIILKNNEGQFTYSYTTPDGTSPGDADKATPEYIVGKMAEAITTDAASIKITVAHIGANAYLFSTSGALTVNSDAGMLYVITSGKSSIRSSSDLPASLPASADGYIVATGDEKAKVYYRFSYAGAEWLEDGAVGSATKLTNMPVSLSFNGSAWVVSAADFEGRFSGDDTTNPDPEFLVQGITGMGSYQGRLVLLAGPMVSLSASNRPRRFYRSTVATLVDDDCIHVGASANSSAAYEYCVPFQKDLLLFSAQYQALIPSGNQAITPRTATVVLTSTYDADMTASPITLGRTLMYPSPASADFFGIMEMLPSSFTDSQYTSVNVTQHLPKYMGGRCRFGVSSSVATMALFAPTGDNQSLIVHEYSWDADAKVQQAWHRWSFAYPIAAAYFAGSSILLLFVNNGTLVGCTIDPRVGFLTEGQVRRPYLDLYVYADVVDHTVSVPAWMLSFDPAAADTLRLSQATGELSGEPVGFTQQSPSVLKTVRSYANGEVAMGFAYKSAISPTAPLVKDENDVAITTNKLTILRYSISTTNSAEYRVLVKDSSVEAENPVLDAGTLFWTSEELQLGHARVGSDATAIVPLRTNAAKTTTVIYTSDLGELNIIGLEYVCRYHQRIKRR